MVDTTQFVQTVWGYYADAGRSLPWREAEPDGAYDPYKILVSELMLQQTQAARVIPKYQQFLEAFPTVKELASAPLADVLVVWNGLGYNRRAKFIKQSAELVVDMYGGQMPTDVTELVKLPGVGSNTAGAIAVYAYNQPQVFIETNIRSVFIHHFFHDGEKIADAELYPLVEKTVDTMNPREWYWALMDYGTYLKANFGNSARASKHHAVQSKFEGSRRQVRGKILKVLIGGPMTTATLQKQIADERLAAVLEELENEGMIRHVNETWLV